MPTRSFVVTLKKKQGYFLIAFWVVYVFVAALLSLSRRGPLPTVFAFEFGFGDLVGSLLQRQVYASSDGLLTGHRMPMIPYFLAVISLISTNGLFVYVVKNLVIFSLSGLAFWAIARKGQNVNRNALVLLALCVFLAPRFMLYGAMPDAEEGYLIHFLAALFAGLFFFDELDLMRRPILLMALAFLDAALFLTKSSMLLSGIVLGGAFIVRSRMDGRVTLLFITAIVGSLFLWGAMNYAHSGQFKLSSSLDGWNLYKGNNELAIKMYPPYNLDILDRDALLTLPMERDDEWGVDQAARERAIAFIAAHPADALTLLVRRGFVLFIEVRRSPLWHGETQVSTFFDWISIAFMAAFRLLFGAMLITSFRLLRHGGRLFAQAPAPLTVNAVAFLAFLAAYSIPYLAGFAYERHVSPIVIPTIFLFLYWTSHRMELSSEKVR